MILNKIKLNAVVDRQIDDKGLKNLLGGASCTCSTGSTTEKQLMDALRKNNGY